jgi:hypothetical protein
MLESRKLQQRDKVENGAPLHMAASVMFDIVNPTNSAAQSVAFSKARCSVA